MKNRMGLEQISDDRIFIFEWTITLNTWFWILELHDSGLIENHNLLFKIEITIFPQFWIDN